MFIVTLVLALSMSIAAVSAAEGDSFILEKAPNYRLVTPHHMSWMSPYYDRYATYGPGLYYDQRHNHFSKVKPVEGEYNNPVIARYFDSAACVYAQDNSKRNFNQWLTFGVYCPEAQAHLSMLRAPTYELNEHVYIRDFILDTRYR